MNNSTKAIIVSLSILLGIAALVIVYQMGNSHGSSRQEARSTSPVQEIPEAQSRLGYAASSEPLPKKKVETRTIREIEMSQPATYISVDSYDFSNLVMSRKFLVTGKLVNSSKTLQYKNILLEINFYDKYGQRLHSSKEKVTALDYGRHDFSLYVRIPLIVEKLAVENIGMQVASFDLAGGF